MKKDINNTATPWWTQHVVLSNSLH